MYKPRIGLVTFSLQPGFGGIPRVARLIERTLQEFADDGVPYSAIAFNQFSVGTSKFARMIGTAKMFWAHRRLARQCSHMIYDSCQMAQLHFRPWKIPKPSLTFIHGVEVWEQTKPRWLTACRQSSLLVANSAFTRSRADELHGGFLRCRVNWLATESDLPPSCNLAPANPTALIVSRIDAAENYKGHEELIDVWPMVVRAVPEAELRIVGRGNGLAKLQDRASRLTCADQIRFEGFVSEERLESMYCTSTLFAMPSRGEGFGVVYAEAMRCGLPVIVSRQDAGQEVIVDGQCGFAVDLDKPAELSHRLIQLLSNPELAKSMGDAGRKRWQENFTPAHLVKRFSVHVHELLKLPTVA